MQKGDQVMYRAAFTVRDVKNDNFFYGILYKKYETHIERVFFFKVNLDDNSEYEESEVYKGQCEIFVTKEITDDGIDDVLKMSERIYKSAYQSRHVIKLALSEVFTPDIIV